MTTSLPQLCDCFRNPSDDFLAEVLMHLSTVQSQMSLYLPNTRCGEEMQTHLLNAIQRGVLSIRLVCSSPLDFQVMAFVRRAPSQLVVKFSDKHDCEQFCFFDGICLVQQSAVEQLESTEINEDTYQLRHINFERTWNQIESLNAPLNLSHCEITSLQIPSASLSQCDTIVLDEKEDEIVISSQPIQIESESYSSEEEEDEIFIQQMNAINQNRKNSLRESSSHSNPKEGLMNRHQHTVTSQQDSIESDFFSCEEDSFQSQQLIANNSFASGIDVVTLSQYSMNKTFSKQSSLPFSKQEKSVNSSLNSANNSYQRLFSLPLKPELSSKTQDKQLSLSIEVVSARDLEMKGKARSTSEILIVENFVRENSSPLKDIEEQQSSQARQSQQLRCHAVARMEREDPRIVRRVISKPNKKSKSSKSSKSRQFSFEFDDQANTFISGLQNCLILFLLIVMITRSKFLSFSCCKESSNCC